MSAASSRGEGTGEGGLAAYRALSASRSRNYDRTQDISPRKLVLLLEVAERTGSSLGQALATGEVESAHTWNDYVRPPLENGTLGSATGVWQFIPGTFHRIIAAFGAQLLAASDADAKMGRERLDLGDGPFTDARVRSLIKETVEGKRGVEDEELQLLRHNFTVLAFAKHYLSVESGATNPEEDYLFHFLGAGQGRRVLALARGEARNTLAVRTSVAPALPLETQSRSVRGKGSLSTATRSPDTPPPNTQGANPATQATAKTKLKAGATANTAKKPPLGLSAPAKPRVNVVIQPTPRGDRQGNRASLVPKGAPSTVSARQKQQLSAKQRVSAILSTRASLQPIPTAVDLPPLVSPAGPAVQARTSSLVGLEKRLEPPAGSKTKAPSEAKPTLPSALPVAPQSAAVSQIVPEAATPVLFEWRTEIVGDLPGGYEASLAKGATMPRVGAPFAVAPGVGAAVPPLTRPAIPSEWGLPADSPVVTGNLGMFYRDGRGQTQPYTWAEFLANLGRLVRADNQPALVRAKYGVGFGLNGGDSPERGYNPDRTTQALEFRHANGRTLRVPEALVIGPLNGEETQYYKQRLAALVSQGDDQPTDSLPPETLSALQHLMLLSPSVQETSTTHPEVQRALHELRKRIGKAEPDDPAHFNLLMPAERIALEIYDQRLGRYAALQACQQASSGSAPDINRLSTMPAESQKAVAPRIAAIQNALAVRGLLDKPVEKSVWRDKKGKKQVHYKTVPFAGKADKATVTALNSFQVRNGLRATQGVIDAVTLEMLGLPPTGV